MKRNVPLPSSAADSLLSAADNEIEIYDNLTSNDLQRMSSMPRQPSTGIECSTALVVLRGEVCCALGDNQLTVRRQQLLVTLDNRPATFISVSDDLRCRLILYSRAFLSRLRLSNQLGAYFSVKQSPVIALDLPAMAAINNYFDMTLGLLRQADNPFRLEGLAALTEAFFYGAGYYFHMQQRRRDKDMPAILTQQFLALVRQHALRQHSLDFYAERLCVTPKYLSACVRQSSGRTALKLLQEHLAQEATLLLREATLPLSEIARQLGFSSTEDFSKYYRRVTGRSPRATRKSHPSL